MSYASFKCPECGEWVRFEVEHEPADPSVGISGGWMPAEEVPNPLQCCGFVMLKKDLERKIDIALDTYENDYLIEQAELRYEARYDDT